MMTFAMIMMATSALALNTDNYKGVIIDNDKSMISFGEKHDVKIVRTGAKEISVIGDTLVAPTIDAEKIKVDGSDLFEIIKKMQAQIDFLTAAVKKNTIECHYGYKVEGGKCVPANYCVSNGKSGTVDLGSKKGQKVPAGIPCTGYYKGQNTHSAGFCQGTNHGGNGWCGVEAPPGKKGKYTSKDGAWAGCSMACHPANKLLCKCEHGVPSEGKACSKRFTPGCQSCHHKFKLNDKKTACVPATTCLSNGKSGTVDLGPKKGQKVPAGIPCTGYYKGQNTHSAGFCQGTNHGGNGWCGVEAPPGKKGKYTSKDGAR